MILGTQWYILFNVIVGASAFPTDLREAAGIFHIRGWQWWRTVILPGIFPHFITGAITASGGAWNASIVAEYVKWGETTLFFRAWREVGFWGRCWPNARAILPLARSRSRMTAAPCAPFRAQRREVRSLRREVSPRRPG
jgi:ABC-type spermidine/putrescine transport system permease subunit II